MKTFAAFSTTLVALALALTLRTAGAQTPAAASAPASTSTPTSIAESAPVPASPAELGRSLADAGNCYSCHTRKGGQPYAGGVPFETPFGTIYSTNITPDAQTGIGRWTSADLRRAMHEGIAADGSRLFPAFPYTSFTKVTDADVDSIFAYLRTIPSVRYTPPANGWMFSMRWPVMFWNALFFKEGRFKPDPKQTPEWNRGAYLVEGLGHCTACHTPRNSFMAETTDRVYEGGFMQDRVADGKNRRWSAVNLTSAKEGLASWSVTDLTKYLSTGFSARAGVFGPMNEVVVNSLAKLKIDEVRAMAVYIKSLPASQAKAEPIAAALASPGEPIYKDRCEKCHGSSGRGGIFSAPPLAGSAIVQTADPASLINIILYGPDTPHTVKLGAWETMPDYADVLTDAQIASLGNFLRTSWGNVGKAITAEEVARQR